MRTKNLLTAVIAIIILTTTLQAQTINFDNDWRFHRGAMFGAQKTNIDDSKWRTVDLPHDWSIEDQPATKSPFSQTAISQVNGGFTLQGTSWYRKTFDVPQTDKGKQIVIQFDGVYMNADVYVNGEHLGKHPYGYTSFYYNITDKLKFGGKNTIAVEVKNEGANSRWYSGSGIYRHVWLKTLAPIHIAQWGTFITTPEVNVSSASVNVKTKLENKGTADANVKVITTIIAPDGKKTLLKNSESTVKAGLTAELENTVSVKNPKLWSLNSPSLYEATTDVYQDDKLVSSEKTKFGIRKISFDVEKGFQLNDVSLKLKGGCIHHDNGPLGAKAYDRAEERKVEILKANGYNAVRISHNPPSPAFLDACDKLGLLVINEAFDMWNVAKNPYDYHLYFKDWWKKDITSMVARDRNHPSVIMWSIGNEIPERADTLGINTSKEMVKFVKDLDNTRPVTAGVHQLQPDKDPYFATLDVAGYNYGAGGDHLKDDIYAIDHQRVPSRIMFGSESYPLEAFSSWMAIEEKPYLIGDFVWTAWDYIGEAGIGWVGYPQKAEFYPWNLAFNGDIDVCGWKRPQSYYRDVLWKKDQLSLFVKPPVASFKSNPDLESWSKWNWFDVLSDWNWAGYENTPLEVSVYSTYEKIELFLNGKSLGTKTSNKANKFISNWNVPYQAGELKAVGYVGKKIGSTSVLRTANAASKIRLTADRSKLKADNQDLSYITVEIIDSNGLLNPKAEDFIQFTIEGDAQIVGVGNGNPMSLESLTLPERKAWKGKCLVIVKVGKTGGNISLTATAKGFEPVKVSLEAVD